MIDYSNKDLFLMDSVDKQLNISYDGGEITNSELASEDFTLTEKLTSNGNISLGECNASFIEFSVGYGTEPLEGKKLTVTITPKDGIAFKIGEYTVVSDKPTADRRWRKITAYDALYGILNEDVTDWYDTILPEPAEGEEPTSITIKQFRDSFFAMVGITQESTDLPNDSVTITRVADFTQLSGKSVLNAICEINGCCGRINREGVFVYQFIRCPSEPFFPSQILFPSNNLFPKFDGSPAEVGENGHYISANYEDYVTTQIGAIQIRNDKNDVGVTVGSGLAYVIEGNFLTYGQTAEVLTNMANGVISKIGGVYYRPADIKAQGNPCLETGDPIVVHTRYATIETIIFQRKLKGIQSLVDTYVSKGAKDTKKNLNSVQSRLAQTDGKINKVEADVIIAKEAVIDYIETNYLDAEEIAADYATIQSLNVVDGKIDNLSAIAITTQNLSAQSINANQITAGTISVTYLDVAGIVSSLSVQSVTVAGLSVTGSATLGGYSTFWQYDADLGQYVLCGSPE
jgi:hypothetical protein